MEPLTNRQAEILDILDSQITARGVAPSIRELMPLIKVTSTKGVTDHLDALARKGYIRLHRETARGIQLLNTKGRYSIPLIGEVAAGVPIEAVENIERYVDVPPSMFRKRPDYLLRVRGESMIDSGIRNGDWIAVKMADTADPGQIVIARHDGDVTVKELSIENGEVVLIPHNRAMKPIRLPAEEVSIVGVYTGGLIRPS